MSEDPSAVFFPDVKPGELDLYAVLSISNEAASPSEIKSAYRRLALIHHPDKVGANATTEQIAASHTKFQQIGFAFAVLSDDTRRKRYDESGRTDDAGAGAKTEAEWKDYFKDLWTGEVTSESIEAFAAKYKGSDEEKQDLFNAYTASKGDLETILTQIMCSTVDDEDRFVTMINQGISDGDLKSTPQWKKASKDTKAKDRRRTKASKEAAEAEAYAKELGVHDKFKGGKGKGKKGAAGSGGDDDEAGLRALIQGNQAKRMGALMDSLEAKYGGGQDKKGSKKRSSTGGDGDNESGKRKKKPVETEPSEEEFAALQAKMDAERASRNKSRKSK